MTDPYDLPTPDPADIDASDIAFERMWDAINEAVCDKVDAQSVPEEGME